MRASGRGGLRMTVVVFGAEKGGVGKTSLALNFSILAADAGADVVLLDTDRQKTASGWLELREQYATAVQVAVRSESEAPVAAIANLSRRHDLVVVDIGAQNYRALVECAMLADAYVVPTSTSALDLDTTEELVMMLSTLEPRTRRKVLRPVVVLSKVPPHPQSREVLRTRKRLSEAGIGVLQSALAQRSAWRSMANTGRALHELTGGQRDERAAGEMQCFYNELVGTFIH